MSQDPIQYSLPWGPYLVRVVNSEQIRRQSLDYQEFGIYAIHPDFPELVPEGEIWVSGRVPVAELGFFITGAIVEMRALEAGFGPDEAYDRGLMAQKTEREKTEGRFDASGRGLEASPIIDQTKYVTIHGDGSESPVNVYAVDADVVRERWKVDFLEGGNGAVYPWIPKDEIWLESDLSTVEMPVVGLHEYTERLIMMRWGVDYDHAHMLASQVEFKYRLGDKPFSQSDLANLTPKILDEVPQPTGTKAFRKAKKDKFESVLYSVDQEWGGRRGWRRKELELSPQERALAVDLVYFPEGITGTNCASCQFIQDGYCFKPEVDQVIEEPEKECCIYWDAPGTKRVGRQKKEEEKALSALAEGSGGALVEPPSQMDYLPDEEDRGQRGGVSNPAGLGEEPGAQAKSIHDIRSKYKKKRDGWITIRGARCFLEKGKIVKGPAALLSKSLGEIKGWVTIRGAHCFVENGKITKGPKRLIGRSLSTQLTKDITWTEEEEKYRGLRSLKQRQMDMKAQQNGGRWITIGGAPCTEEEEGGEHCDGTPVYVRGNKIEAGPENLTGQELKPKPPSLKEEEPRQQQQPQGPQPPAWMVNNPSAVRAFNLAVQVAERLGYDQNKVIFENKPGATFTVGGNNYQTAANCDLNDGKVTLFERIYSQYSPQHWEVMGKEIESQIRSIVAHEVMHAKFQTVWNQFAQEYQGYKTEILDLQNKMGEMTADDINNRMAELRQIFPVYSQLIQYFSAAGTTKLRTDDGVTGYSRAYWNDTSVTTHIQVHETLAEIAAEEEEGRQVGSPSFRKLYEKIVQLYPNMKPLGGP